MGRFLDALALALHALSRALAFALHAFCVHTLMFVWMLLALRSALIRLLAMSWLASAFGCRQVRLAFGPRRVGRVMVAKISQNRARRIDDGGSKVSPSLSTIFSVSDLSFLGWFGGAVALPP